MDDLAATVILQSYLDVYDNMSEPDPDSFGDLDD